MRVWIGYDGSDIGISSYFSGAVVSYGTSTSTIDSFCWDTGKRLTRMSAYEVGYTSNKIADILEQNPGTQFVFSDPYEASLFPEASNNLACLNPTPLLRLLNSKTACRQGLKGLVPMLPYASVPMGFLSWERLRSMFPGVSSFLIQDEFGAGGARSYVATSESQFCRLQDSSSVDAMYSVSPFLTNCLSVNQTVVVAKNGAVLFQPSLQIIDDGVKYSGSDFAGYTELPDELKRRIREVTRIVADKLQRLGYRGIAGIDLIVDSGNVYFGEINPRFQGSSFLLDRVLYDKLGVSLYEINERAFLDSPIPDEKISLYSKLKINGMSRDFFYTKPGDEMRFVELSAAEADGAQKQYDHYDEGVFLHRSFFM